ncbi:MAG: helix-turn-helix domain-containing protein [Pseudonocardiaceae bacterium]
MALRRQRLSQRRKAVGLTQESLAQRLGVERSTVARWEAGDTEPLPSIRPDVAQALQVSIDELAELLTESDHASTTTASTTRALSANTTEVTIPVPLSKIQSEVWLGRAEFEDLIRPQVAETVETLRSDGVHSDDVSTENLAVGRSSEVPLVAQPISAEPGRPVAVDADAEVAIAISPASSGLPADPDHTAAVSTVGADIEPYKPATITVRARGCPESDVPDLSSVTTIPLNLPRTDVQWHRARSQRFKRFAAAGILVVIFAGGAASVPFTAPRSAPIPPAGAGNPLSPAPEAAIPAPSAGSGHGDSPHPEGSTEAIHSAPADAPGTPAGDPAPPAAAAVPAPHTIRASNPKRPASRPKPPGSAATPPAPRTPAIPAEAYAWSEMAAATAGDHRRARVRPEAPPHP